MNSLMYLIFLLGIGPSVLAAQIYSQSCRSIGEDYLQFTVESDLSVNSTFNFKVTAFEDRDCKTPNLKYNQYFTIDSLEGEKLNLKSVKSTC